MIGVRRPEAFPLREIAAALGGVQPVAWERVVSGGYGRVSAHWLVSLSDGRMAFVKQALTDEAVCWVRKERLVYESIGASFLPAYLGAHDDRTTLLVLEDLSAAHWPPPWSPEQIDSVLAALAELHATPVPAGIEPLEEQREAVVGWSRIAADPEPLLRTGLCSRDWLEGGLPTLLAAGDEAELDGDELLHFDVRSDNLCFVESRTVLVDWNLACRGNGRFDVAFWLPSLHLEGGPEPWKILPGAGALAAAVAGFFAVRAGLPPPSGAPTVRQFQLEQAAVALPWAALELGLSRP
jgi:hypothetical protein